MTQACAPAPAPPDAEPPPAHFFVADGRPAPPMLRCGLTVRPDALAEFRDHPLPSCSLDFGLARPTRRGTSVTGTRARMTVRLVDPRWSAVSVRIRSVPDLDPAKSQAVRLFANGTRLGESTVPTDWATLDFGIPAGILQPGDNVVELEFDHAVSASDVGRGTSKRPVAAYIQEVWLTREGARRWRWPRVQREVAEPTTEAAASQVWDLGRERFVVSRTGSLALSVAVPSGADRLEMTATTSGGLKAGASTLSVRIEALDGAGSSTPDLLTPDALSGADQDDLLIELPVAEFAGQTALVIIEASPRPKGAAIELSRPRLRPGEYAPPAERPRPPSGARPEPDIVLLTLDAARPNHFSGSGYHRPTTPRIDRFSEQALVFRNAFALAPYTLCSVPSMITGLSFLDHGVVMHEDVLSSAATTLAESLRDAGYRTACFTATPNNSAAKGFDQGYDEFFELWTEVETRATSRDPHYVTRRVIEWLEEQDEERPLHLQVHYIPPHAPYEPAEPFNLFANRSYGGPCTGRIHSFDVVEYGLVPDTNRCVGHLIDLYDGNLRAADDAVGLLLDALSRRKRWPNTVVLITSDHGEAFLEHGRMTHNSTVYDEMLRVPFVLRLPGGDEHSAVDTDQMVTLADITPTLLGAAGLSVSGPIEGVDLLDPTRAPGARSGRYFIARNADSVPLYGLRSHRWKAILSASGFGGLYDLHVDPGEHRNLIFERAPEFAALGLLLTERVSRPPTLDPSGEIAEITDTDREMLEALGYTQ